MRFIALLLSLVILVYLMMNYLKSPATDSGQVSSRPKEVIDRAEQQVNQAVEDYQKKLNKLDGK